MNKSALTGLFIAFMLPVLGYFLGKKFSYEAVVMPRHYIYDSVTEKTVNGKKIIDTVWHKLPEIQLTNQLGQKVSWKDMEGKIIVADFFFTKCPTICPRMTMSMKRMQDGISNAQKVGSTTPDFIHFLSFSVDPERDSVQELKKWADRYQINPETWWLLTGDKKQIYDLSINDMKVLAVDGKGQDTSFFHTDFMVLIDKNRNIRGYYHGLDSAAVAKLSNDIVLLALEKDPHRKKFYEGKLEQLAIIFILTIAGLGGLFYFLKKRNRKDGIDN